MLAGALTWVSIFYVYSFVFMNLSHCIANLVMNEMA